MIDDAINPSDESQIRYRAARRGLRVMQTRGLEHDRREKVGVGTFMLLDQTTNSVALFALRRWEISQTFLKANDKARRHHLY
jgi:hypothetical protein